MDERASKRYMETLDKMLTDYAFAGIQAVGLVPRPLLKTALDPQPSYCVTFRQAGELHTYKGTYAEHMFLLVQLARRK